MRIEEQLFRIKYGHPVYMAKFSWPVGDRNNGSSAVGTCTSFY